MGQPHINSPLFNLTPDEAAHLELTAEMIIRRVDLNMPEGEQFWLQAVYALQYLCTYAGRNDSAERIGETFKPYYEAAVARWEAEDQARLAEADYMLVLQGPHDLEERVIESGKTLDEIRQLVREKCDRDGYFALVADVLWENRYNWRFWVAREQSGSEYQHRLVR